MKHLRAASRRRRLASAIVKTTALAILCFFAVALLIVSNSYSFVLVRRQLAKLEGAETRIRSIIDNILDGMITVDERRHDPIDESGGGKNVWLRQ